MKAAVFVNKQDIRIQEIDQPVLGDYDVRVRNKAVGICGTDIHIFNGEKGSTEVKPPVVLGHEYSGQVVEVGRKVTSVAVGDRVTVDPNIYCGKCRSCRIGKKQQCENLVAIGVNFNGGFAEYSVVPENQVYKLEPYIDYEVGALAEPLACCLHGIDLAHIKVGDVVCVIGGGTIGQLMVQLARLAGASTVVLSEPIEERRTIALANGADKAFDPAKKPLKNSLEEAGIPGADVVVECAGVTSAVEQAFNIAARGGTIVLFSVPSPEAEFPLKLYDVFKKELTIRGSMINPDTHQRAVDLINAQKVNIKPLITHRYGLEDVVAALQKQVENDSIKVLVKP